MESKETYLTLAKSHSKHLTYDEKLETFFLQSELDRFSLLLWLFYSILEALAGTIKKIKKQRHKDWKIF